MYGAAPICLCSRLCRAVLLRLSGSKRSPASSPCAATGRRCGAAPPSTRPREWLPLRPTGATSRHRRRPGSTAFHQFSTCMSEKEKGMLAHPPCRCVMRRSAPLLAMLTFLASRAGFRPQCSNPTPRPRLVAPRSSRPSHRRSSSDNPLLRSVRSTRGCFLRC